METLSWIAAGLALLYFWLRGHWFAWVVAWIISFFIYQAYAHSIDDPPGSALYRAFVTGAVSVIPAAFRLFLRLRTAGKRSVDELYREALANPEVARRLISQLPPGRRNS